ncbi:sigma-70 family RNA polymerase sigma factor [Pseudoroseomonas ludipueritiae]|uniref:Sigma-70 family RNA polymerase sigma factor n=1 Tax=Pseudoroseomonas ludipueritiae TaxID=198093 RepID=A0ABR7R973_9PROT|nr:sigma-70 family RNA polymerase sigma factor [Pseudoroseomonas ludipueritiae]MBC9178374.1 sigma-70 family RNA polymerase sigma factor [Pseudoroseomonas ludipueritiae]MCG7362552.1 sigma-70 family RNA polymerase sigma factor [Roseomonas sp. ACRSG]
MTHPPESVRASLPALLPDLRAFARFLARDAALADDLVQEAVLRALRAETQWVPGTSLRAWVFHILRNVFLEQMRRRGTERRALERLPDPGESGVPQEDHGELEDLGRALQTLPLPQREALILVGAHGLSHEEAAIICAVPVGTVKARVSRARAALARSFPHRAI